MQKNVQYRKSGIDSEANMGPATRAAFAFLKSSLWVNFLETLSGIKDIIPDPHYRGSGVHLIGRGGHLALHADFNRYETLGLRRRVNTFIYLNHDWPEEYGGHLELWNRNMTACGQRILPSYGRFVVFSSTDFSYHGHPIPLSAPQYRMRRSLALYYFTNGCPRTDCQDGDCDKSHSTLWKTPNGCRTCQEPKCRAYSPENYKAQEGKGTKGTTISSRGRHRSRKKESPTHAPTRPRADRLDEEPGGREAVLRDTARADVILIVSLHDASLGSQIDKWRLRAALFAA
jgi:hypothetical protein